MSKKAYWLGEKIGSRRVGRVRIGKIWYEIGDEIPLDKVTEKKAAQWRKSGAVGETKFHAATPINQSAELKKLRDTNQSMDRAGKALAARVEVLEAELADRGGDDRVQTLEGALETAREANADLKTQLAAVTDASQELETCATDANNAATAALSELNDLKSKVLGLDSEAKAVVALKEEVASVETD